MSQSGDTGPGAPKNTFQDVSKCNDEGHTLCN